MDPLYPQNIYIFILWLYLRKAVPPGEVWRLPTFLHQILFQRGRPFCCRSCSGWSGVGVKANPHILKLNQFTRYASFSLRRPTRSSSSHSPPPPPPPPVHKRIGFFPRGKVATMPQLCRETENELSLQRFEDRYLMPMAAETCLSYSNISVIQ